MLTIEQGDTVTLYVKMFCLVLPSQKYLQQPDNECHVIRTVGYCLFMPRRNISLLMMCFFKLLINYALHRESIKKKTLLDSHSDNENSMDDYTPAH
jgi:hypothetical protein